MPGGVHLSFWICVLTWPVLYKAKTKITVKKKLAGSAPVFVPNVKPDLMAIKMLQCVQNSCMRLITGCHKMASQDHLLAEFGLFSIAEHLKLVCYQFLASASHECHPSHGTNNLPTGICPGRKEAVHTLQSKFGDVVKPYLRDGVLPESNY
jgi:hypothetical protein